MSNISLVEILWMFLIPLIAVMLPLWLGQKWGLRVKAKSNAVDDASVGSAVGATLGLLAFMLGLTFQIVGNRYDTRKELYLNEILNLKTTYLYAGLLPDPYRTNSRKMILDYVDVRAELIDNPQKFDEVRLKSEKILDTLWRYSEELAAQDRSSEAYSLFTTSVSQLVNLFDERLIVALQFRLPLTILYVLSFVAFLSMLTLGFQFGVSEKVNFLVSLLLGITFAVVMWLIFALDRPEAGLIKINQAPFLELQDQLHKR